MCRSGGFLPKDFFLVLCFNMNELPSAEEETVLDNTMCIGRKGPHEQSNQFSNN